jgi:hypothetical protein
MELIKKNLPNKNADILFSLHDSGVETSTLNITQIQFSTSRNNDQFSTNYADLNKNNVAYLYFLNKFIDLK